MNSAVKTLKQLSVQLQSRQVSAVELAKETLTHIEKKRHLNAFLDVQTDLTLAQARAADAAVSAGSASALCGIPIAHKDIFVTQGWKSTAGSKILQNYVSPFNATVVEKLQTAGMVCVGKTNCDEFAMGGSGENSAYGPTLNPKDETAVPGGSTSGSAAAIAAGIVPAATGTDTGGSIRQPASFCGLTGIKPTYGRVSRYGMIAFASSLDQAGPMAHTAEDCALLLNIMAGFDPRDSTSLERSAEDFTRLMPQAFSELKGLKLCIQILIFLRTELVYGLVSVRMFGKIILVVLDSVGHITLQRMYLKQHIQ